MRRAVGTTRISVEASTKPARRDERDHIVSVLGRILAADHEQRMLAESSTPAAVSVKPVDRFHGNDPHVVGGPDNSQASPSNTPLLVGDFSRPSRRPRDLIKPPNPEPFDASSCSSDEGREVALSGRAIDDLYEHLANGEAP